MRYDQNIIYKTIDKKPYYKGKLYPDIPYTDTDDYIITNIGDRLDLLAYNYYKDPELWWIISVANNHITKGSMFPAPGLQLRIPTNVTNVLRSFNELNGL